jgi:predicted dehydrogenase
VLGLGAAAPHVITSAALGAPAAAPASERVRVGFIGLGGHGIGRNLRMFLPQPDCQVGALCDVDSKNLARGQGTAESFLKGRGRVGELAGALITKDWRKVIESDVDAVMVSTPDHWHCLIAIHAVRAGKDVICEKPTYNIEEGRVLADTVKRYGAVFQTSTEDRSVAIYHKMAEVVRNRRIGKLTRMIVTLPQAPGGPGDPTPKPVPDGLDWDMWLGPAPWRPYNKGMHPFRWRAYRDYSGGGMTDWGAHHIGGALFAAQLHDQPLPVAVNPPDGKDYTRMTCTYASGVKLYLGGAWDGPLGFKGSLGEVPERGKPRIPPPPTPIQGYRGRGGIFGDFVHCVKTRQRPFRDIEIAHRAVATCHLCNIAFWLKRPLKFDPEKERFIGDAEADRWLDRPRRGPWTL